MDPSQISWLAVVGAAVATFLLGGLWYAPFLFGGVWQRLNGLDDAALKRHVARTFAVSFVLALVQATNLAFFIGSQPLSFAVFAALATGLGFVAPALFVTGAFERRPFALLAIDAGYHVVSYLVMGLILGLAR